MSDAPLPTLPPIGAANAAPPDAFAGMLAPLFEDAGPVAGPLAARRPFGSWEALLDAAAEVIAALPIDERMTLLRAHPRIGEAPDELKRRSALSYAEQGGEDTDAEADARLGELNADYEARHGFPFVIFVAGRPRSALVSVLRKRLDRTREEELASACDAVLAIGRDRLASLFARGAVG